MATTEPETIYQLTIMRPKRTYCDCGSPATTIHANAYVCEECKRVVTLAGEELDNYLNKRKDRDTRYMDTYSMGEVEV